MPEGRAERVRDEDITIPGDHEIVEKASAPGRERRDLAAGSQVVHGQIAGRTTGDVEPTVSDLEPDRRLSGATDDELLHIGAAERTAVDRPVTGRSDEEAVAARIESDPLRIAVCRGCQHEDLRRCRFSSRNRADGQHGSHAAENSKCLCQVPGRLHDELRKTCSRTATLSPATMNDDRAKASPQRRRKLPSPRAISVLDCTERTTTMLRWRSWTLDFSDSRGRRCGIVAGLYHHHGIEGLP